MGSIIQCFWCEPTDQQAVYLRRFVPSGEKCDKGKHGYHHAWIRIEDAPVVVHGTGNDRSYASPPSVSHDDPRWPKACPCGRVFKDTDYWQEFGDVIYRRADTGALVPLRELPAGAMWDAWWLAAHTGWKGKDGICLMVKTPAGDWCPDQPSKQGRPWNRTGDVKAAKAVVSATPSILFDPPTNYHAHLVSGRLVEC